MSMTLHTHTPTLTTIDPRGLTVGSLAYWRSDELQQAERRITHHFYDPAGRLIASQDPRLSTSNQCTVYSLSGQPLLTDSVDAGWRLSLLGETGQAFESWESRGSKRQVEYDELLRPVAITEQDQVVERFTYGGPETADDNQCNQLMRHDDTAGTVYLPDYGLLGLPLTQVRHFLLELDRPDWPLAVTERSVLLEANGFESSWAFDATGDVIKQTDAMGNTRAFEHTVAGQLKSVSLAGQVLVTEIHYNAFAQVERETWGNGVISQSTYDPQDGRLIDRRAASLQHLRYVYDPVGNILQIEDATQPVRYFANQRIAPISHYRYDTLYQLIEASGREVKTGASHGPALPDLQNLPPDPNQIANYTQSYEYDAGGNLLQMRHVGAQPFTRVMRVAPNSNRSLPEGELDFEAGFDANGNLQQLVRGQDLSWDARNQLRQIITVQRYEGPSDSEVYIYDGNGQRCRKVSTTQAASRALINEVRYLPGLEFRSTVDGEVLHVIFVNNARMLHWQAGKPDNVTNDQMRYSFSDHLGSSALELDQQGGLISQESYYPFGGTAWWAARSEIEAKYKTVRYSGKERDASGLYYHGFRYYAPWLQRWINPDPAGDVDGLNYFIMAMNNPINHIDPDGRDSISAKELWHTAFESIQERKNPTPIRLKTVAPGIVSVSVMGTNEVFSKIGMGLSRPFTGHRHLSYLAIDSTYKSKLSGGDYSTALKISSGADIYAYADVPDSDHMAFINGGFYNKAGEADPALPNYAAIGKIVMAEQEMESVDLPQGYGNYYVPLTMSDGSTLHSAPLLTTSGRAVFTDSHLAKSKFQYNADTSLPGQLGHANTPNQRSGISLPMVFDSISRTRIAVGLGGGRSQQSRGYTMPEWAQVMLRLDNMNAVPGRSINLDGGDSSSLGVVARSGQILMDQSARGGPDRRVGNFLSFYR